jgi:hypothetical protein
MISISLKNWVVAGKICKLALLSISLADKVAEKLIV